MVSDPALRTAVSYTEAYQRAKAKIWTPDVQAWAKLLQCTVSFQPLGKATLLKKTIGVWVEAHSIYCGSSIAYHEIGSPEELVARMKKHRKDLYEDETGIRP